MNKLKLLIHFFKNGTVLHNINLRFKRKIINSNESNIAFLHIPKTGGSYLTQIENFNSPVLSPIHYLSHSVIFEEKPIDDFFYRGYTNNFTK